MSEPRMSSSALRIMRYFVQAPHAMNVGTDIMRALDLGSGTVYPTLKRLEKAGWLKSKWGRKAEAWKQGRPPYHMYYITSLGLGRATRALSEFQLDAMPQPQHGDVR